MQCKHAIVYVLSFELSHHYIIMALVLSNINLRLCDTCLLDDFSLTIQPGEIKSIMGPSGCGKSTLLSWIAGSLDTDFSVNGLIQLDGRHLNEIAPHKRQIGILFQDDLLFPHMSVRQNLMFALPAGMSRNKQTDAIEEALASVELAQYADSKPYELSGGQRVRVALMRMLLSRPKAILLDEPFSKLDSDLKQRIRQMVFSHIRRVNVPALMVTHDMQDALATQGSIISFPMAGKPASEVVPEQPSQQSTPVYL